MFRYLLHSVIPSLTQLRENRTKKKYEKNKQRLYEFLETEKRQRLDNFLKINRVISKE